MRVTNGQMVRVFYLALHWLGSFKKSDRVIGRLTCMTLQLVRISGIATTDDSLHSVPQHAKNPTLVTVTQLHTSRTPQSRPLVSGLFQCAFCDAPLPRRNRRHESNQPVSYQTATRYIGVSGVQRKCCARTLQPAEIRNNFSSHYFDVSVARNEHEGYRASYA